MANNLVIVESPAKAKTIGKYLGADFEVKASMGHVRDLPKSKIGVDVERDFALDYQPIKGKEDIISDLKKAAKKYLLGFKDENYKGKDLSLANQIYQQRLTIEHNKRNYARLVEQCDGQEDLAKYSIALAQATLESLYQLQELIEK